MSRMLFSLAAFLSLFALAVPSTAAATASNDEFVNALSVASLPFSDSVPVEEATSESGEPTSCIGMASQTVWYAITPASDDVLRLTTNASFYWQFAAVYAQTGSGLGGLSQVACIPPWLADHSAAFSVEAGKMYYIQAGAVFFSAGVLGLALVQVPPPANDDFADATSIATLPYSATVDASAATNETGEPTPSCSYTGKPAGTVWYRYTPSTDGWVSASTFGSYATTVVAAYTGSSGGSLTEEACRTQYARLTITVRGGQTYYFLVGGLYGVRGAIAFQLQKAADPVASFAIFPGDPSSFDTVQFSNFSYDPAEVGISSSSWSFGDGTTATTCCPSHRYTADGDYTARLTVTTTDGRTGSISYVIHVKTHDVTISKFTVPQTAAAGQTRAVTVGLSDTRGPETVQVQLFKNDRLVGTLVQDVPVRTSGRTTPFGFTYTFTSDDAALGKVTFEAVATIVGARDAQPSDNTAIALPTHVNG